MTDTAIGRRLDQIRVFLVRASRQTIAVEWLDDAGAPTTLASSASVTLEVDLPDVDPLVWDGSTGGSDTTWHLTAAQTDIEPGTYKGRVVITDGDPAGPLVALSALITVQ